MPNCARLIAAILLASELRAQTACASQHPEPGAFICSPNRSEHPDGGTLHAEFHLSAQANAPVGHKIGRYVVFIDDLRAYETRLTTPAEQVSIEINIRSPFNSGLHTIRLLVDGVGVAEVPGLDFNASDRIGFCDLFSRVDRRNCVPLPTSRSMVWSLGHHSVSTSDLFSTYIAFWELYSRNLKSVEADLADAFTVDQKGNLYTASHSHADVDIRKYAADGSLLFDQLIRSCGTGFVSVESIAVEEGGRAWIAGNTTACLVTSPAALETRIYDSSRLHGFLISLDTAKTQPDSQVYLTYLSRIENKISGIRLDRLGNVYVTGVTGSMQFPHQSVIEMGGDPQKRSAEKIGFVAALNSSGSALLWSTLVPGVTLNALAFGHTEKIYVTGRALSMGPRSSAEGVLVAELSDQGRRVSYLARLDGSGIGEGRAVSIDRAGRWLFVAGERGPINFPGRALKGVQDTSSVRHIAIAFQPCKTGKLYSKSLLSQTLDTAVPIAMQPALDAFGNRFEMPDARIRALPLGRARAAIKSDSQCAAENP